MLNAFVCGNFNHHEEEEDGAPCPNGSPKKSKRKDSRENNPYSTRGLDKFSALLADLDQRRQKVYSQMNPHDISFVRFAYSKTDDFVPIVVKVKNNNNNKKHKSEELKVRHTTSFSEPIEVKSDAIGNELRNQPKLESEQSKNKKKQSLYLSWKMLKRPSFYVPAVMILILVLLTVFGRSVATLCTCVVWYVVPTLSDSDSSSSKQSKTTGMKKKKDYVRGLSEKKMVVADHQGSLSSSPTSGGGGDSKSSKDKSSAKHSHQNSW